MNGYGTFFLDVLSCVLLIEVPTYANRATLDDLGPCQRENNNPCRRSGGSWDGTTYDATLNVCFTKYYKQKLTYADAKKFCREQHNASIVEPNLPIRTTALSGFGIDHDVCQYWVGLYFRSDKQKFFWSRYGDPAQPWVYPRLRYGWKKGQQCVIHEVRGDLVYWKRQFCNSKTEAFCAYRSAFMPIRPSVSWEYDRFATVEFEPGATYNVTCRAFLGKKGDLRILVLTKSDSTVFDSKNVKFSAGKNTPAVRYSEALRLYQEGWCMKTAVLTATVEVSRDMEGAYVACSAYEDKGHKVCASTDPNCQILGFIKVFKDRPARTYKVGDICGPAAPDPCSMVMGTYISELNACVYHLWNHKLSWESARETCHEDGAFLVQPNTKAGLMALVAHAATFGIDRYWIGLKYNSDQVAFVWANDSIPLTEGMLHQFGGGLKNVTQDECVMAVRNQAKPSWVLRSCSDQYNFFCTRKSVFMPSRPTMSVANANLSTVQFRESTDLKISCEAMLSQKGDLSFVLFSDTEREFYGHGAARMNKWVATQWRHAQYSESLRVDTDGQCKKHGVISVTLRVTPDLDLQTLACISYIDGAVEMCSQHDPYCDVAGTIRFSKGQGGVTFGPEVPSVSSVLPWWAIIVVILLMSFSSVVIPMMVERLDSKGESVKPEDGAEEK